MCQPPGFEDKQHPTYICCLHKAIYNLKQSLRQWFGTLTTYLQHIGFHQSSIDAYSSDIEYNSIFVRYVDDILLTGDNPTAIKNTITKLHARFQMRELDPLSTFLGIQIARTSKGLILHQQTYAKDILHYVSMKECHPLPNPSSVMWAPKICI